MANKKRNEMKNCGNCTNLLDKYCTIKNTNVKAQGLCEDWIQDALTEQDRIYLLDDHLDTKESDF